MIKRFISLAIGSISAATLVLGSAGANAESSASATSYCRSLIDTYQHDGYAKQSVPLDVATAVAIEQCREGNGRDSIPVLEQKLHEAGIALPARS